MKSVNSPINLRHRVLAFLSNRVESGSKQRLLPEIDGGIIGKDEISTPISSMPSFLNYLIAALPEGDVYLFGGFLRDLAISGRRNFNSDIDIVIEGDWSRCSRYLEKVGATKNKFGGYRHVVANQDIDIWYAPETWAIKSRCVQYENITSLLKTTILNWDAILMDWRSKSILMTPEYLDNIREKHLDIVLSENPDPVGMIVRILRQISKKKPKTISLKAAAYLSEATKTYSLNSLIDRELKSYGANYILHTDYIYFKDNLFLPSEESHKNIKLNFMHE